MWKSNMKPWIGFVPGDVNQACHRISSTSQQPMTQHGHLYHITRRVYLGCIFHLELRNAREKPAGNGRNIGDDVDEQDKPAHLPS